MSEHKHAEVVFINFDHSEYFFYYKEVVGNKKADAGLVWATVFR